MKNLAGKLREGMTANEIDPATQEMIIQNISSIAQYSFPESHAASAQRAMQTHPGCGKQEVDNQFRVPVIRKQFVNVLQP
jgi:hypothetical protein